MTHVKKFSTYYYFTRMGKFEVFNTQLKMYIKSELRKRLN